ncbi:MAG: hypothetical protein C5B60_02445 [Chloroflexi bacterium]|nr:MAG: hypothetical protein C5B60_02445 [Chloroflexota bacterium]
MPGPYPLPRLAVTIDAAGAAGPTFVDILESLRASFRQIFGQDLHLAEDTQDGQWLATIGQTTYDVNMALVAAFLSFSPSFATGAGLSSLVKINGLRRLSPSNSTVGLRLVGRVGTVITGGVVADTLNNLWDLPATVTIPSTGEITVTATARNPGAVRAEAGTITRIQTLMPGWDSATNPMAARAGLPLESDAVLRQRQALSTAMPAITPIGSIYSAVANVPGAGRLVIYENDTPMVDTRGLPSHSFAVIVEGGEANAIARAIALKKTPGTCTFGTTSVTLFDSALQPQTINFFYVERMPIVIHIAITPQVGYASTTGDLIRRSVARFVNQLPLGQPVFRGWLATPATLSGAAATEATGLPQAELRQLAETYVLRDIQLGTATGVSAADIVLRFTQAAQTSPDDIGIITR